MEPTRWIADAELEQLARRLRFLGHDVVTHRGVRLEELFELAARDGRTVLTTSRRHPKRHAAVSAQVVPRGDDAAAVRAIDAAHRAASAPFTRCPRCNTALLRRSAFEAQGEVPGRVTRAGGPLRHCPSCGQWYWIGSHVARIREWLESTLERGIEPPDAGGPPAP